MSVTKNRDAVNISRLEEDKPPKNCVEVLESYFGYSKFRPMQWQIIKSIIEEKRDNCAVMATGYGKSLCYQFPAVMTQRLTVVISPLISLMEDQVQSLEVANIPACFLGTAQNKKNDTVRELLNGEFRLVYMTPEYASSEVGSKLLSQVYEENGIGVLAIDEAHCVSQWGHDFRPAYRHLGSLRQLLPTVPILAVSATATEEVQQDIIKSLNLKNPQVLCSGFDRPNLYFKVVKKSNDPYRDITQVLQAEHKCFNISNSSVIIYCLTRKITEKIAQILKDGGLKCDSYHAGLSINVRRNVHKQFLKDEIKIIVATIAFGMGIDKPNVRCVIHYGTSCDMEGYYQEAGRAGRDGNPSLCILYHSPSDFVTHKFLRDSSRMSQGAKSRKESLNMEMKRYVTTRDCRRHLIVSYFEKDKEASTVPQTNCCDNCTIKLISPKDSSLYEGINEQGMYDFTEDTDKFLSVIEFFHPKSFGVGMIVSFLKGSKAKKMHLNFLKSNLHGCGSTKSENWWKQIAIILEQHNYIKKLSKSFGTQTLQLTVLNDKGLDWLKAKRKNTHNPVLLPPTGGIVECLKVKSVKPLYEGKWISTVNPVSINTPSTSDTHSNDLSSLRETIAQDEYLERLHKDLLNLRHTLAQKDNGIPHQIASDNALYQMALSRPLSINQLTQGKFDGMPASKIEKFGAHFISTIQQYVGNNPLPTLSIRDLIAKHPIERPSNKPNTFECSYIITFNMFTMGKSIDAIASERNIGISTVATHIASVMRNGYDIDMKKLIPASTLARIIQSIKAPPIYGDYQKLAPIKAICPEVSYPEIHYSVAYLKVRDHLKTLNRPYYDNYALVPDGNSFQYSTKTITPSEESSKITSKNLSQFSFSKREVLTIEKDKIVPKVDMNAKRSGFLSGNITDNIVEHNEWGEDDLFLNNVDHLNNLENKFISNNNNAKLEIINDNENLKYSTEDIKSPAYLSGNSSKSVVFLNDSLSEDEKSIDHQKISDKNSPQATQTLDSTENTRSQCIGKKSKSVIYLNDSESDDEISQLEPPIKRKLPDCLDKFMETKHCKIKKMEKRFFL